MPTAAQQRTTLKEVLGRGGSQGEKAAFGGAVSDHNRSNVRGVIAPRSTPTFFDAMTKAGLEHPTCLEEDVGNSFLDLLVAVVDHELVGSGVWYDEILGDT